jgi:biopolymer transport protein ExbD
MAEINYPANSAGTTGVRRSKKLSTKVDLTPMVDLGFLLITFFIFSSKLSESKALKLVMPAEGAGTKASESTALTVIPFTGNTIFYYHGALDKALQSGEYGTTTYSLTKGLGQVIRTKQITLDKMKPGFRKDLMLMIKPSAESVCRNMVDILDEVQINQVGHYAIMDLTPEEKKAIAIKTGLAL